MSRVIGKRRRSSLNARRGYAAAKSRKKLSISPRAYVLLFAVLGLAVGGFFLVRFVVGRGEAENTFAGENATPSNIIGSGITQTAKPTSIPIPTVGPNIERIIFTEKHVNQPSYWEGELLFSCGTGSPDTPVLRKLILYNIETNDELLIAESTVQWGEIYETLMNERWIIWLDTDHGGTSIIYALERSDDAEPFVIKTCKNGKPKLRLSDNTLIWMEPVSNDEDKLYLFDLETQENLPLTLLTAPSSYGVSAPGIDGMDIVWAGADADKEGTSIIYTFRLDDDHGDGENLKFYEYKPGTYVHEPIVKGRALAWIDTNKSPKAGLYVSIDRGAAIKVDDEVSTYALGDGFLAYGKNEAVWIYSFATGEKQRLTFDDERAILPTAQGNHVIWFEMNAPENKDCVKVYTVDEKFVGELTPLATDTPAPKPTATPEPSPEPPASGTDATGTDATGTVATGTNATGTSATPTDATGTDATTTDTDG